MGKNTKSRISNKRCCNKHPKANLIKGSRAGDMICSECGLGDRVIDVSSECRTFSNTETFKPDINRCASPENPLLSSIGPGTGSTSFNQNGAPKYTNQPTKSSSDRTLPAALMEISAMAGRINLSQFIVDRAKNLFKQVHDQQVLRGRSTESKAAACIYLSCREKKVPHTFNEICAVSKVSKKEIGRCFKLIVSMIDTKIDVIKTDDFMPRFCTKMGLPHPVECAATHIAKKAVEMNIVPGRSPVSVAAAAIYMAAQESDHKRTQKQVGESAGVAELTLRQAYKLMVPHTRKLFPENFIFKTRIDLLPCQ